MSAPLQGLAADRHVPMETNSVLGGVQYRYSFDNGYGASVVQHAYSYGGPEELWELAVLGPDKRLTYDTPITDDVLGRLSWGEVLNTLDRIGALPAVSA